MALRRAHVRHPGVVAPLGPGRGRGGDRGRRRPRILLALGAAVAAGTGVSALCGGTALATVHAKHPAGGHRGSGLVGYPSYLPKRTLHFDADATLVGTAKRPALTSQGDAVRVVTPHGSVIAVVTGPEVPGEGLPYQGPSTTCTWTVSLSHATAPIEVSAADFDSINDAGAVFHPAVVPGTAAPPNTLEPGQTVSFELRAAETVGEGLMRWAPDGKHIAAKWDFVVEND
jgi:hypothetical protein